MEQKSSIPRKDVDFNVAQEVIVETADENRAKWGLDSVWMDGELLPEKVKWEDAWSAYVNPAARTPAITFAKTGERKVYEKLVRKLVKNLQSNVNVTPDDLRGMGIVVPSSTRTPAPIATESPDTDVDTSVIAHLIIHFFRKGGKHRKGKPEGQRGVEIRWIVSDVPPARWDDLIHSGFDTNSPYTLEFENDFRGKTVYFALRWENTRGDKGPWSEIESAIIP
jgi:hypothetical protein